MKRASPTPIKPQVLPLLDTKPMTSAELFKHVIYPSDAESVFRGGLHRLEQRGYIEVDRSIFPHVLSISRRGREHVHDIYRGIREGQERRMKMIHGDDWKPKRKPVKRVRVSVWVKKLDPVQEIILHIMIREGAVTIPELHEVAKVHGYPVVVSNILKMVNAGFCILDTSVDPMMYHLTPDGEEFFENHYAMTP